MNPFKLFDPSYLFDTRPGSEFLYFWPLVILFVAVFAGSFKVKMPSIAARMREFSIVGMVLTFFRDQNIPYLGMRSWLVLLFVAALVYGVWEWKAAEKKAEEAPTVKSKKEEDKYLPKSKKKKSKKKARA